MRHFILSWLYSILSLLFINLSIKFNVLDLYALLLEEDFKFAGIMDFIGSASILYCGLFILMGTLFFIGLAIYHLAMIYYYTFAYKSRKIHTIVDENDIIQDTYLELADGKIIPIKITRLVMDKPKVKEATGE